MIVLLPASFVAVLLMLANLRPHWGWRRSFLRAAVLWALWVVLTVEVLSPSCAVTRVGLTSAWSVLLTACVTILATRLISQRHLVLPNLTLPASRAEWILVVIVAVILGVTGLIAGVAPPSTWDSLNYHMARVAHWIQMGGVRPFATGIEVQNGQSPWAEMAVLHTVVLAGDDRFANFVAWGALLGSLVGVTWIAGHLGGTRRSELLSAVLVATLPTVLAQASSTMTDLVVGLWVVVSASEVLDLEGDRAAWTPVSFAAAAAGLALLTKPTAAAYLAPFGLLAGAFVVKRWIGVRAAALVALALAIVLAINAGHVMRNWQIYGRVFDPGQVAVHANQERNLRGLASNFVRNLALNAGTPSPHVNKAIYLAVAALHDWLGLDPSDPRTTSVGQFRVRPPSTHENTAGNPVHAWLYLAAVGVVLARRRVTERRLMVYLLSSASTLVVLSFVFKWQIFGGRFQVPSSF